MVRGTAGRFRYNTRKAQYRQIQFINEGIDNADRVIFPHVVVQAIRQQDELAPVLTLNKTLHPGPPEPQREYQISRSHTAWPQMRHSGTTPSNDEVVWITDICTGFLHGL